MWHSNKWTEDQKLKLKNKSKHGKSTVQAGITWYTVTCTQCPTENGKKNVQEFHFSLFVHTSNNAASKEILRDKRPFLTLLLGGSLKAVVMEGNTGSPLQMTSRHTTLASGSQVPQPSYFKKFLSLFRLCRNKWRFYKITTCLSSYFVCHWKLRKNFRPFVKMHLI